MFLLNSCLGLFSAACFQAPLLPKLRGHFAEFLDNASPVGLRILSSPTCVGLRYGYVQNDSGFSWQWLRELPTLTVSPSARTFHRGICLPISPRLGPVSSFPALTLPLRPHSSVCTQYWNINQLSIDYAFRPRLRSRLPQSRSALLWNPWIFGLKDSHLHLATHSGILSSHYSTAPSGTASPQWHCSSTA